MRKLVLFAVAWVVLCPAAFGQYTVQHYYPGLEQQLANRNDAIKKLNEEERRRFNRYLAFQREQARQRGVEADRQHTAKYGGYVGGAYINPNYRGQ